MVLFLRANNNLFMPSANGLVTGRGVVVLDRNPSVKEPLVGEEQVSTQHEDGSRVLKSNYLAISNSRNQFSTRDLQKRNETFPDEMKKSQTVGGSLVNNKFKYPINLKKKESKNNIKLVF
jgi:hypothetical protein